MAGSFLLVEELFERGDPTFERALWRCADRRLLPFCQRWSRDRRLFARRALLGAALDPPLDGSARLVVKVLFKAAERQHDDIAMAHFMVGFDRSVRREASTTRAPFSASTRAKRAPSPLEAPVTMAVLPLRSKVVMSVASRRL